MIKKKESRLLLATLGLVAVFSFSACGKGLDYTSEQEDVIADYAANLVLRHDANYKYNYINEEAYEEESTSALTEEETSKDIYAEEETGGENGSVGTETISADKLAEVLHMPEGITVEYTGYEVSDTYSDVEDNLFVMKAVDGHKLLVVEFRVVNTTNNDISLNMMANVSAYKGIVNETKKYNAQLTLLLNAMNTYEGVIPAGTTKNMMLIYQTQLESKDNLKSLELEITDKDGKKTSLKFE